jgi:Domain of unknown function (DUF4347)/FG-GAP-like repeat
MNVMSTSKASRQFIFVDFRVPDLATLIRGVARGHRLAILDRSRDGIEQIADALAAEDVRDLSAIHIVSHGRPGEVELGSIAVKAANLSPYRELLAAIGASLAPDGAIRLYGCEVGAGTAGRQFLERLSAFTGGANVAAATHVVGASRLGGNWELDASLGSTSSSPPFGAETLAAYRGLLNQPPTLSNVATNVTFTQNPNASPILFDGAVVLSPSLSVSDSTNVQLTGATVAITGGTFANDGDEFLVGDTLFGQGSGSHSFGAITVSMSSSSETLILSGTDSLADYQSFLQGLEFTDFSENATNYGSNPTRTLTWVLNNGDASNNLSAPQTTTLTIVPHHFPPILSNVTSEVTIAPSTTGTLSPSLTVSDPDSLTLAGATVAIVGGTFAGDGDVLAANTAGTSITASYNSTTETLTLSGADTLADYQQVLERVTYHSTAGDPSNGGANPLRTVTWVINDGSATNNLSTTVTTGIDVTTPAPKNDFNGDGKSDLLWQSDDGLPAIWEMNGTSMIGGAVLPNSGPSWHVVAAGDFNGDGKADIVWQNDDGLPVVWEMNGASIMAGAVLPNSGASWHIIATGDFNGDGKADILWQSTDGLPVIWEMNGTSIIGAAVLPNSGPTWRVIATGDFNGDGKSDIIWQNTDGLPFIWEMNGATIVGAGALPNSGPSWHVIGTGDFDGDRKADILWQADDGLPVIWEMNGTSMIGGTVLPNSGPSWHVIGTSDLNGDGKSDIIWQNTDGLPFVWEINGASIIGAGALPNSGASWHVKDDGPIPPDQMGSDFTALSGKAKSADVTAAVIDAIHGAST